MAKTRDDFSPLTKSVLARRVGYKCSNPNCGRITEGPHSDTAKYLSIGVAAHITAASKGGPRFDAELTNAERQDIKNGIWLCEEHAKIIDKDPDRFTKKMLIEWKERAEAIALSELIGKENQEIKPFLEAELRFLYGGQTSFGENTYETNKKYGNIAISPLAVIWDYKQDWNYDIVIYNNSKQPAYNVKITNKSKFGGFKFQMQQI